MEADDENLDAVRNAAQALKADDEALSELVAIARRQGATWQQLAGALGVSRQAAAQRFGRAVAER